jgi:hypothetical protein
MRGVLLLFETTRSVIKAERLLKQQGLHPRVVPIPRSISSECGMALEVDSEELLAAQQTLAQEQIALSIHTLKIEEET